MTIIVGIDPGSRITGYGVIAKQALDYTYVASGCIKAENDSLAERLQTIFTELQRIVQCYRPSEAAIEQVFFHRNPSSALKLGEARGVTILVAGLEAIPVTEYSARQIKQSVVGYGAAKKAQVQHMIQILLNLKEIPAVDAADALAIAFCHAQASHYMQRITQHPELSQARFSLKRRFRQGRLR